MKKLALLIPFIISSCALFGPTYTGETTASSLLKSDTERNINLAFRAIHNCTPKQIHTQKMCIRDRSRVGKVLRVASN